jgi:hypothetical protein
MTNRTKGDRMKKYLIVSLAAALFVGCAWNDEDDDAYRGGVRGDAETEVGTERQMRTINGINDLNTGPAGTDADRSSVDNRSPGETK